MNEYYAKYYPESESSELRKTYAAKHNYNNGDNDKYIVYHMICVDTNGLRPQVIANNTYDSKKKIEEF